MENQALSNESPPDEPDLGPEEILAQMGIIEASIKKVNQNNDGLDAAKKYTNLMSTVRGAELAAKYKSNKRFVLLVLGSVFEQVFGQQPDHSSSLAVALLNKTKAVLGEDNDLIAEVNVLSALYLADSESYMVALHHFLTSDKKRACTLALSFKRYEDFVCILKDEADPLQLVLSLPADPFIRVLQSFLLGHQLWRAKTKQLVQKLKASLDINRLATFAVKLGSLEIMSERLVEFTLQLAVELGQDETLRLLSVPLLSAVCRCVDDSWCPKVPIGVVSDACELLNSLQNSFVDSNGSLPLLNGEFFLYFICLEKLAKLIPSYIGFIRRSCASMVSNVTQLIRFDSGLCLFKLGRLFIADLPEDEPSENEEGEIIFFKKETDISVEFEQLALRKQHLSSQALSLPSTYLSFDLRYSAFVIDTNVLVAHPSFLESLYDLEARVYVPVIVLEELVMLTGHPIADKSSKAKAALNWLDNVYSVEAARKITIKSIFATGRTSPSFDVKNEPDGLGTATNDDLILKICMILSKQQQSGGIFLHPVIISDDVNMRLKSKAMGIQAASLDSFTRASFSY